MRAGKLSKRELATLRSAMQILDRYVEYHEEQFETRGEDPYSDYDMSNAMAAEAALSEFVMAKED